MMGFGGWNAGGSKLDLLHTSLQDLEGGKRSDGVSLSVSASMFRVLRPFRTAVTMSSRLVFLLNPPKINAV